MISNSKLVLWQGVSLTIPQLEEHLKYQSSLSVDSWEQDIITFALEWLDERNSFFWVPTSGSTGAARKISVSRKQMVQSALATGDHFNLQPGNKVLLALPAHFIAGKMMIVRAMVLGLDLYYLPPEISVIEYVTEDFDFCALIPLQLQFAIDHELHHQIEKIKMIIIGGAPLSADYQEKIKYLKPHFFATYGMTETITHIAIKSLNRPESSHHYSCLPGIAIDKDENDCLRIFSDRLPQKVIQTHDRIKLISDQEFDILGRADFVINSGGLKIQPEEIEAELKSLIKFEFMIGYKQDALLGQKLVLMIEAQEGQVDTEKIFEQMKSKLAKNHVPKEIVLVPKLFRTENHKMDRLRNVKLLS